MSEVLKTAEIGPAANRLTVGRWPLRRSLALSIARLALAASVAFTLAGSAPRPVFGQDEPTQAGTSMEDYFAGAPALEIAAAGPEPPRDLDDPGKAPDDETITVEVPDVPDAEIAPGGDLVTVDPVETIDTPPVPVVPEIIGSLKDGIEIHNHGTDFRIDTVDLAVLAATVKNHRPGIIVDFYDHIEATPYAGLAGWSEHDWVEAQRSGHPLPIYAGVGGEDERGRSYNNYGVVLPIFYWGEEQLPDGTLRQTVILGPHFAERFPTQEQLTKLGQSINVGFSSFVNYGVVKDKYTLTGKKIADDLVELWGRGDPSKSNIKLVSTIPSSF